jgi:hypothetical protein
MKDRSARQQEGIQYIGNLRAVGDERKDREEGKKSFYSSVAFSLCAVFFYIYFLCDIIHRWDKRISAGARLARVEPQTKQPTPSRAS